MWDNTTRITPFNTCPRCGGTDISFGEEAGDPIDNVIEPGEVFCKPPIANIYAWCADCDSPIKITMAVIQVEIDNYE